MTDIDLVLWDIGQVVYQSPFERFDELEDHTGMARGTLPRGPFVEGGGRAGVTCCCSTPRSPRRT